MPRFTNQNISTISLRNVIGQRKPLRHDFARDLSFVLEFPSLLRETSFVPAGEDRSSIYFPDCLQLVPCIFFPQDGLQIFVRGLLQ